MSRHVLVTGARGKTGREVTDQLRDKPGVTVRAGSSDPSTIAPAAGVEPTRFDWADRSSWAPALDGVDGVWLMRPDLSDAPELVAELAGLAGNAHLVLLSEQGADTLAPDHWARRVEEAFVEAATAWTVLRPGWFHQVLTDSHFHYDEVKAGTLSLPDGGIAFIDARDIAAVAVAALLNPDEHRGSFLTLTGPAASTPTEITAELSRQTGRTIVATDPPPLDPGTTPEERFMHDILEDLRARVLSGGFGAVTPTMQQITGRPPRSIQDFIAAEADRWG
ncbi:MAG TPA: NAD(P)H-binding protein [Conexibacter sp.]|nr:NAD(P)H-binding protein [Conexibacter sp.]